MSELMNAITVQNETRVLEILAWINFQEPLNGYTPLFTAIEFNNSLKIIQALVNAGANVHHKDFIGNTALHIAAIENRPDVIRFLIRCGCDKDAKNHEDQTPIMLTKEKSTIEALKEDYKGTSNPSESA